MQIGKMKNTDDIKRKIVVKFYRIIFKIEVNGLYR